MADTRDFSAAAESITQAYAQYAMRSAFASTHALHLYEQVIGCVARRQLAPDVLQTSLIQFARAHTATSQANITAATTQLIAALATRPLLSSNAEVIDVESDSSLDPNAVATSIARVAQRMQESATRAFTDYIAKLTDVANGDKSASELRRETTKQINKTIASDVSHTAHAWFEFLGAIDEARGRFAERYLMHVLRNVNPIGFDRDVVELRGPINTRLDTTITLENSLTERTVLRCVVSDVRRVDGVGPAFIPSVMISPNEIALDSDAEAQLNISLLLDDSIYDAHAPYVGSLRIARDDAPRLDIPLRITPTPSSL